MIKAIVMAAALALTSAGAATAQDAGRSQYETGYLAYVRGEYAEAVRWYRMAADQGYGKAQINLGDMYVSGRGIRQNDAEAERDALPKEVRYFYRLEGVVKSDVPVGTEIYL